MTFCEIALVVVIGLAVASGLAHLRRHDPPVPSPQPARQPEDRRLQYRAAVLVKREIAPGLWALFIEDGE